MVFARRRTTEIRPVLPWAPTRIAACAGAAVILMSPWPTRPAAQEEIAAADRDASTAWLAALPPEPAFVCGQARADDHFLSGLAKGFICAGKARHILPTMIGTWITVCCPCRCTPRTTHTWRQCKGNCLSGCFSTSNRVNACAPPIP